MSNKVFIDTNIFVYAKLNSQIIAETLRVKDPFQSY